jgi:hypothetical protein
MPRRKSDPTEGAAVTPDSDRTETDGQPESPPDVDSRREGDAAPRPPMAATEEAATIQPGEATETPRDEPLPPAGAESEAPEVRPAPIEAGLAPTTAVDEPAPEADDGQETHEEEAGPSFAGRALTFLLLLLAGAALGIWGAPKLAPLLPSGLAPVANWLTPAQRGTEAELATLRTQVEQGIGGVEARIAELSQGSDVDAQIEAAVGAAEARLTDEMGALRNSFGQLDTTEMTQRISRLESSFEGQASELAGLKEQLSGSATASGQISEEAVARIDVYRAELDGLRAEMGTLQDQVGALATRIDEVAAVADRQISSAQSQVDEIQTRADTAVGAAAAESDAALIRAALAAGQPFAEPLARLAAHPGITIPAGLEAAAPTGVATLAELRDSYPDAAHAAIRAGILASSGEGLVSRSRAFFTAQVASRSLTPKQGMDPDAVLSRMEDHLRNDDLTGALAEAQGLPSEAAAAMSGWLDAARLRVGAVDGLAEVAASLPATN